MGDVVTDGDFVQSFQIEGMNVRGRVVHLTGVADRVLGAHDYPDIVSGVVAEALTVAALLGASLKFSGMLTLQTRSDGPVRMIVADYSTGVLRACATFDREAVEALGPGPSFAALAGAGSLAITIDPGEDMERYQGVVRLDERGLAHGAVSYFERSEQIPTAIKVASAMVRTRGQSGPPIWRAGGIMIQNLATLGGKAPLVPSDDSEVAWTRASALFETVDRLELVDPQIESEQLLYRLYHEDGVRAFSHQPLSFGCRCSAERVMRVLSSYSREELSDLVEDNGAIRATCEFCSTSYRFTPDDLAASQFART